MVRTSKLFKILLIVITIISIVSISGVVRADFQTPNIDPQMPQDVGNKIDSIGSNLLGIFQAVGYTAAVIILVWLGIKYIIASPEGKADVKKQAYVYILGAVLLFSASAILTAIKALATL